MIGVDYRSLRISAHAAGAQQMHGKLLFADGGRPFLFGSCGVEKLHGALAEPVGKLDVVRMVFVREAESRKAPGIFQVGIKRKAVALDRKRCAVAEKFHGAREIVGQSILESLAPARRAGRQATHSKPDGSLVEAGVQSAASVNSNFLMVQFVKIVDQPADRETLVVVERMLEYAGGHASAIEHQVFADNAAGIGESVGELL